MRKNPLQFADIRKLQRLRRKKLFHFFQISREVTTRSIRIVHGELDTTHMAVSLDKTDLVIRVPGRIVRPNTFGGVKGKHIVRIVRKSVVRLILAIQTVLAGDIVPEPLKSDISSAMEKTLTGNDSEFFDQAMIESLLCATTIKAAVNPEIFKTVFDAWRMHQVIKLSYKKPNGEKSERNFEPHIIAFHQGIWYVKGYEHLTRNIKSYAIQRISKVEFALDVFVSDKHLVEHTRRNGLFEYPRIDGVKLHCDASTAFYLYEHQKVKKFKIEPQPDGSLIITLRPAIEHEVIRFVLGEAGRIRVLYPEELRKKVAEAGKNIWEKNS